MSKIIFYGIKRAKNTSHHVYSLEYGFGDGYGYGRGSGDEYGYGDGPGDEYGDGFGDRYGNGYGNGSDILSGSFKCQR